MGWADGMKNTDGEIRDGVWADDTKANGADIAIIDGNIGNFQAQTNLQTLLAVLGIPDTLNKPLYTCLVTDRLDNATYGLSALNTDLDAVKAKTDLLNSTSGSNTLNDVNVSDTIVPPSLPTNIHVVFDISTIIVANDDFTIEVKVGASGSELVVSYYKITSDGTDTTIDTGSGTGAKTKARRIDISDIMVYTGEQVLLNYTKNSATDRNVPYEYVCGV